MMLKKILNILFWLAFILATVVAVGFAEKEHANMVCPKLDIYIDYEEGGFVTQVEVLDIIYQTGDSIVGQRTADVNLERIRNQIAEDPFVDYVRVYRRVTGAVVVDIQQRKPIVRVINNKKESCYLDGRGYLLPLDADYIARVPVLSGHISDQLYDPDVKKETQHVANTRMLKRLFPLIQFINGSDFWKAQIAQIYINEKNEIELVPLVGDHVILFGGPGGMVDKFEKLFLFYNNRQSNIANNDYKLINLIYQNQVVCTKSN